MKMRKRLVVIAIFIILLIQVLSAALIFHAPREEWEIFVFEPDEVCYENWGGFNGDALGESCFDGQKVIMHINDTSGSWGLSKISRGLMPHYWGVRYAPLVYEIEIDRETEFLFLTSIILEVSLKLVDYQVYTPENSSVNVAIVLFFDGYKTDYQVKCYQTEIQFFSYFGSEIQAGQVYFFEWRGDSVAQFKLASNLKMGELKIYRLNISPYIQIMMNHYKLNHVKLMHIEVFTESYKGYCMFELYDCKLYASREVNNVFILAFFAILFFLALLTYRIVEKRILKSHR
jgi:hypothetical protein